MEERIPLHPLRFIMILSVAVRCLFMGHMSAIYADEASFSIQHQDVAVNNTFIFSPRSLHWTAVSASGDVVRTGRGSGGRDYCRDVHRGCRTPTGTFHIISKGGADCRSSRFPIGKGGAPMPYCMFFSRYYGVHGSYDVPHHNASHGCVRITPSDARWLSHHFMHVGTTVEIQPY